MSVAQGMNTDSRSPDPSPVAAPNAVAQKGAGVRVHVAETQQSDAEIIRADDGELVLSLRPGLISDRAYVAVGLALSEVVEDRRQQLHDAG